MLPGQSDRLREQHDVSNVPRLAAVSGFLSPSPFTQDLAQASGHVPGGPAGLIVTKAELRKFLVRVAQLFTGAAVELDREARFQVEQHDSVGRFFEKGAIADLGFSEVGDGRASSSAFDGEA
jgi:hypothetical protein